MIDQYKKMVTPMPGIFLFTHDAALRYPSSKELETDLFKLYGAPFYLNGSVNLGSWLRAGLLTKLHKKNAVWSDLNGLDVFFDGYLSDVIGKETLITSKSTAQLIAELYREEGCQFVTRLRGSFLILVVDARVNKAILFTDRSGSRPVFMRAEHSGFTAIAPQMQFLSAIAPKRQEIDPVAIVDFLLRGCFSSQSSLFVGIKKIPGATSVEFTPNEINIKSYWQPNFVASIAKNELALVEELDELLVKAACRTLRVATNPLLLLTGGRDSRIMLAALLDVGVKDIPTLTYAVEGTASDEVKIAKLIAEHCKLSHEAYEIKVADYHRIALKEVLSADGQVQMCDAPSDRWEYISTHHDCVYIGDHSFARGRPSKLQDVQNISAVLNRIGLWNLSDASHINDWLISEKSSEISAKLAIRWEEIVHKCGLPDLAQLEEVLFYQERVIMMQMGYANRRLWLLEHARPLLDEDIVDFSRRIPPSLRVGKKILARWLEWKHPDLAQLPYSTSTAVPWHPPQFINIASKNKYLHDFLIDNLVNALDTRLEQLFDIPRLNKAILSLFSNQPLPPLRREWIYRLPGFWRFAPKRVDKVGAVRGAVRLLNLNLYLKNQNFM